MPDTCFCERCLQQFARETRTELPKRPTAELSRLLLTEHKARWVQWRCDIFTDWVREFRQIIDATRPGALRNKLAIDLKAQAKYVDVFSIMPYHARFGHHTDPAWVSRQTAWLGRYLGITGQPGDRHQIWPIVQLSDWGETVPVEQVRAVLDHGTRLPATGVMIFAWGRLHESWEKVEEMGRFYRAIKAD
jgi:hypothetical protein